MSKSLLKTLVANHITELNIEIGYRKKHIQNIYKKCDKADVSTGYYFSLLNLYRNIQRNNKRKLRNLEKLQKRIKELPDELLDTAVHLEQSTLQLLKGSDNVFTHL